MGKVGRAVLCPPSGIGREINVALSSCGGQRAARPAIRDWRITSFQRLRHRKAD